MRRPWLSTLFSGRRPVRRRPAKPNLVTLEDRTTPTVTASLAAGVLTVSLDAAGDTAFLRVNGANQIEVAGDAGFASPVAGSPFSSATAVAVQDTGAKSGQSVTFAGTNAFVLPGGVTSAGVETASVEQALDTSGGAAGVSLSASAGIAIDAAVTAGPGSVLLTSSAGNILENAAASISAAAVAASAQGVALPASANAIANLSGTATAGDFVFFSAGSPLTITGSGTTATGAVTLSAPAVSVQAGVSAGGIVSIAAVDSAGPGNNLSVAAGVTISTTGGNVTLNAGDALTLAAGSLVKTTFAGATIALLVDQGSADPGTGGTANTVGADLQAPGGATITGGADDDSFTVSGTTAALSVDGGGGTNTFTFDAQGTSPTLSATTAQTPGKATTTFANPGSYTVIDATGQTYNGTAGNDVFLVKRVAGVNKYQVNGGNIQTLFGNTIAFNGLAGSDHLVVDYSGGDPVPSGGITFDGGGNPGDGVAILGSGVENATYGPDAATPGQGVITIGAGAIAFRNLTPIDVSGLASFTLSPPNANDVVNVAAGTDFVSGGTHPALRLTGTSGGVAFESVAVWNTTTLTLDTTAGAGADAVTLASANDAHGVTNLVVLTGGNAGDAVTVPGPNAFAGTVTIASGGSIGVSGTLSAGGAVALATTDSASAGQDITVAATGKVLSGAGVSIQAGDNLTVAAGGQIHATAALSMAVDVGNADATGGTATLTSADLAGASASLAGNGAGDTFLLSGYSVALTVDGKGGTNAISFNGTGGVVTASGNTITRSGLMAATVLNVEALSIANALTAAFSGAVTYANSIAVVAGTTFVSDGSTVGSAALSFNNATAFNSGNATFTGATFDASGAGGMTVFAGKTVTVVASGAANFNVPVDGPGNLVVNAAGTTTFAKNVGATSALGSLGSGNPAGKTVFQGTQVLTTGAQSFADDVSVTAATTVFQSGSGAIGFGGSLNGAAADASAVALNAAAGVTFAGKVGDAGRLTKLSSQTGTTISGGLVNTQADQTYTGAVTYTTDGTQLTSAAGPITVANTLDANSAGNQSLTVDAGTGAVVFQGAVGVLNAPQTLTVKGGQITANGAVAATDRADFTVGSGGMTQGAGAISAKGLGLFGTGNFALGNTANDVGATGLRVNLTANGAAVAFSDANQLSIDNGSTAAGIKTTNGNVTLKAGTNFLALDAFGNAFAVPIINLGAGSLAVFPGLAGPAKVVFNAEVLAGAVTLGTAGAVDANSQADTFSVRPSANVQIAVNGNAPLVKPGDVLSVIASGTTVTSFVQDPDPTNGKYTFNNRFPIVFTSIEQFGGLQAEAFVVQTNDVATSDFRSYAVRFALTSAGANGQSNATIRGSVIPSNSFVVSPQFQNATGPFNPVQIAFGDVNGDGIPDLVVANGQDSSPLVTVINGIYAIQPGVKLDLSNLPPGDILAQFNAFEPTFFGGVSLAVGDLDGNGKAEIVVGAGVGGAPRVRVLEYNGSADPFNAVTTRADFFGYESTFRGGINVAAGDTKGDGSADVILGTGYGGGPRVRILDGSTFATLQDFFAYEPSFRGGVYVGAGQYEGNGKADVVTGPGFGGGPRIRIFRGTDATPLSDFFAFSPTTDVIGGDNTFFSGVGGVAFGRLIPGSTSQQAVLVASPRGRQAQALSFFYNSTTLQVDTTARSIDASSASPTDQAYFQSRGFADQYPYNLLLNPLYFPGAAEAITPDVRTLRDAVSVAGFASSIL